MTTTCESPASTFDWVSRLRGLTGGRGTATLKVDGYDVVPEIVAKSLLSKA
jgi:translation elongation factor EF-G